MLQVVKKILHFPPGFLYWVKSAGWLAALTWTVYRTKTALGFQPSILKVKPHRAKYPVLARLGDSSDMTVFCQIFQFDEYACLRNISSPSVILDLGANVGYSSAYLLSCFPAATVVAIEPDPDNFELCRKNLAPYGDRAQVVLGAVWSKRCRLVLSRRTIGECREWATQVRESEGNQEEASVEAWDVPGLLQLTGGREIDLLKVDIERSEMELFGGNSTEWLPLVRNICIELHGADCREVFLRALKDYDYTLGISGELTICRDLRRKKT
jgi:FkbM family methyltransferase